MKITVEITDGTSTWEEAFDVVTLKTAAHDVGEFVQHYNKTKRTEEPTRRVVKILGPRPVPPRHRAVYLGYCPSCREKLVGKVMDDYQGVIWCMNCIVELMGMPPQDAEAVVVKAKEEYARITK